MIFGTHGYARTFGCFAGPWFGNRVGGLPFIGFSLLFLPFTFVVVALLRPATFIRRISALKSFLIDYTRRDLFSLHSFRVRVSWPRFFWLPYGISLPFLTAISHNDVLLILFMLYNFGFDVEDDFLGNVFGQIARPFQVT